MTVEQLIEALEKLHPVLRKKEVYTEGCDCWGDSGHVRVTDDNEVLICRGSKEDWSELVAKAKAAEEATAEHEAKIREKYPDFI